MKIRFVIVVLCVWLHRLIAMFAHIYLSADARPEVSMTFVLDVWMFICDVMLCGVVQHACLG